MTMNEVQLIRDAFELIVADAPEAPLLDAPVALEHSLATSRRRGWLVAAAAALAVLVAVGSLPFLIGGSETAAPTPQSTATTAADPAPVLPADVSDIDPPPGASWVCPPFEPQDPESDQFLTGADVPDEIRYLPATEMDRGWAVDYGPACNRPPALVAVNFTDEQRTAADAVIVVWVEFQTAEPSPYPSGIADTELFCYGDSRGRGYCFDVEPSENELAEFAAQLSTELWSAELQPIEAGPIPFVEEDGFGIRQLPNRVEMVGVIDGLPVWIEASGLDIPTLQGLVGQMTADAVTGQVELSPPPTTIEVVHSAPVIAEVVNHVVWNVEGPDFSVQVWRQPYIPYSTSAVWIEAFRFTTVGDTVAIYSLEGGGTSSLSWEAAPGVRVYLTANVDGATVDELVTVAETLGGVPPDHPDLPPPPNRTAPIEGDG
ncbi:MAG: hypothetical protein IIC70_12135 [Acidobacteria bacterium]|nr:hypothetical protein [Acidobacteriota bacterium]